MSPRVFGAVARRVLTQLRRDRRSLALMFGVPAALVALLHWVMEGNPAGFDRVAAPMVGLFPFITMFIVTSVNVLRERTTGTLERLMTLPLGRGDLLLGYAVAFAALSVIQVTIAAVVTFVFLDVPLAGAAALVVVMAISNAVLGSALGLFASAFAATEFQAVQFMPALVLPQLLLCGLFVPRDRMAPALEAASNALPLTYAFEALQEVAVRGAGLAETWDEFAVVWGCVALALAAGAMTLRRRTA